MIDLSIIIPTLNAAKVLKPCLQSIKKQDFPSSKIEIIVADGGSVDNTIKIAKKYGAITVDNPLKTAESGKAIALKSAKGKFIALIDSDNILPHPNWLRLMLSPFKTNPLLIGTEPIRFTYRPHSGFIERYSALIGANDPYAFFTGIYDRYSILTQKWTNLPVKQIEKDKFFLVTLKPGQNIPTIGANGTIFRSQFIKKNLHSDYLFDIDLIASALKTTNKPLYFAKVKTGVIHTFCESSLQKFIKKQTRRIVDYYQYLPLRTFDWSQINKNQSSKFALYSILIIPAFFDSLKGFIKKPDYAIFFHPIACFLTLIIYSVSAIKQKLKLLAPMSRRSWKA